MVRILSQLQYYVQYLMKLVSFFEKYGRNICMLVSTYILRATRYRSSATVGPTSGLLARKQTIWDSPFEEGPIPPALAKLGPRSYGTDTPIFTGRIRS